MHLNMCTSMSHKHTHTHTRRLKCSFKYSVRQVHGRMRRVLLRQTWGGRGGTASTDLNLCEFLLSSISLFYQPIFGHFLPFYYPARITLGIVEVLKTFVVHKLSCPTCPREQFPELFPNKKGHYLEQTAVSTTCCYCTV